MSSDMTKDAAAQPQLSRLSSRLRNGEPALYALLRIVFALLLLTHGVPKALGSAHGEI